MKVMTSGAWTLDLESPSGFHASGGLQTSPRNQFLEAFFALAREGEFAVLSQHRCGTL